jgi:glycosyltransferase involved in cell wall biosynthesis
MPDASRHIAIDGRELVRQPTGVGRYLRELMQVWARTSPHRYSVVLHGEPFAPLRDLGDRFSWIVEPDRVGGTWWEQMRLPRALRRLRPDVLLAPAYTAPLRSPCPFVVVVHDVSYFAHPDWFGWRTGLRRRLLTRAAAKRAHTVVTVSEFSRGEVAKYVGIPAGPIRLAPPSAPPADPPDPAPRQPVILYVGSLFNRRRLPDMLRTLKTALQSVPDARLVLVGDNRTSPRIDPRALARDLGVADRVDWREYVTDEDLDALYRRARVFLFLSDYEGFGITPFEAAGHGVPAVVLDTPVSREVYGDGVLRVPPDPDAIAEAVTSLLTDDARHRSVLAAGRARLSTFSWERSAAALLRTLEEAASGRDAHR